MTICERFADVETKICWHNVERQTNASGAPTKLAIAAQALVDNGCDCDDIDETGECTGECLPSRCDAALHEQFDRIQELESDVTRILKQTSGELANQGANINNLIASVEGIYPYLTDEVVDKLKAAVAPLKGTK